MAQAELELELSVLDFIEAQTYEFLTAQGIPSLEQQYLIGFQKRLWKMALKFEGSTYNQSRGLLTEEYILRGHTDLETVAIREGLYLIVARAKIFKLSGVLIEVMLSRVKVRQTWASHQTIAHGVPTKVTFDTVELDTLSEWDVANNKFTALEGGYFLIDGHVTFSTTFGPTDEYVELTIRKNGTIEAYQAINDLPGPVYAVQDGIQLRTLLHLVPGDTIELWATQYNTLSSTRNINGGTNGEAVNLSIMRLTPGAD